MKKVKEYFKLSCLVVILGGVLCIGVVMRSQNRIYSHRPLAKVTCEHYQGDQIVVCRLITSVKTGRSTVSWVGDPTNNTIKIDVVSSPTFRSLFGREEPDQEEMTFTYQSLRNGGYRPESVKIKYWNVHSELIDAKWIDRNAAGRK